MSDKINNGGPAYPQNEYSAYEPQREGMSLRDWFAGQALIAIFANPEGPGEKPARWAYMIADAMIAARKVGE